MNAWKILEEFADRFTLKSAIRDPRIESHFGLAANYCQSLISLNNDLRRNIQCDTSVYPVTPADDAAQQLIEALIAAVSGMYSTSAGAFRGHVEAVFRAAISDDEVLERLPEHRQAQLRKRRFSPTIKDYEDALSQTGQYQDATKRLYVVYSLLSQMQHFKVSPFSPLEESLFAFPYYDDHKAKLLSLIMNEGCLAGAQILQKRLSESSGQRLRLPIVTQFQKAVERLKQQVEQDGKDALKRLNELGLEKAQ